MKKRRGKHREFGSPVYVSLEAIRRNPSAIRGEAAAKCPDIVESLGLSGARTVAVSVLTPDCDYFIEDLTVDFTPDMSVWTVLMLGVHQWEAYPAMDALELLTVGWQPRRNLVDIGLHLDREFTDAELSGLPLKWFLDEEAGDLLTIH